MKHLLIVGRSGIGKTSMLRHLARTLRNCPIDGFLLEELREQDQRVGYWLSPLDGRQLLLAHRRMSEGVRAGPYRVHTEVLEHVAVPVIRRAVQHALVLFVDELGRLELTSPLFREALLEAFDRGPCVIATVGLGANPFVAALKQRKDVEIIPLTASNRQAVQEELTWRLQALCAEDEQVRALQRQADRICEMIVSGDSAPIDIEIQQQALRETIAREFPEKQALYQLIFESRFRRLWQQFRQGEGA